MNVKKGQAVAFVLSLIAFAALAYGALYGVSDWGEAVENAMAAGRQAWSGQ